jgi:predicted O-linked N-acetylglucosamine transferase (SPINDLY family)
LKFRGFDQVRLQQRFAAMFAERGVAPERLEFQGWSAYTELQIHYRAVDLALDPFPFSGSATTCEALWMGVPVITCPGETFASRQTLSHLSNVGLTDTIAGSLEEYVDRAALLAGDLPRLAAMRAGLRQQMAASPLCDGPRFARNLMAVLREAWRQWAAGAGPNA